MENLPTPATTVVLNECTGAHDRESFTSSISSAYDEPAGPVGNTTTSPLLIAIKTHLVSLLRKGLCLCWMICVGAWMRCFLLVKRSCVLLRKFVLGFKDGRINSLRLL
jgi:hypothetical protein